MEMLISQIEQLPSILAASRSGLVQGWDPQTLMQVLSWADFFQQLHSRLQAQPSLWDAVKQHLSQRGLVSLDQLRRCPELLGLAFLENQALPSASRHLLFSNLFCSVVGKEAPFVNLLARRRAASQLLHGLLGPALRESAGVKQKAIPPVSAQAQLLLLRLQRDGERGGGRDRSSLALMDHLHCGPMLYRVVAAALLEPGWEVEARILLLPWLLLGDPAHLSSFCRLLSAPCLASLCTSYPELFSSYFSFLYTWGNSLIYNPLCGEWQTIGLKEDEVPWQELQERIHCLSQEPEPLSSAVHSQLRQLKAQDGDFEVRGLSVWTDLLFDMETSVSEKKPGRFISLSTMMTKPKHLTI